MLSILTLNINYYVDKHGPWSVRKELIREAIQKTDADIVALQAVRQDPQVSSGVDQARQFSEMLLDYKDVIFQPAVYFPDGSAEGSAILSRLPIAKEDYLELSQRPNLEDTNQRMVLHARFDLSDGPFHLFNAHFSWVEEQTRDNLKETIPFINAFSGPAVLVGDLNTPSGSPLLRQLTEAGWTDVWEHLHPGAEGYTFEANDPSIRIDYVFVNQELKAKVRSIEIVSNVQEKPKVRLSDHLGLRVVLDLRKGQ